MNRLNFPSSDLFIRDSRYTTSILGHTDQSNTHETEASDTHATAPLPTYSPPPDDPSLRYSLRLEELSIRAQRLRDIYKSLLDQQTDRPNPQLTEQITNTAFDHNKVCEQYAEVMRQSVQAQSSVPASQQTPAQPNSASTHKRQAPEASLEGETAAKQRRRSESTSDSSSDEPPLCQWGPAHAIEIFKRDNAARLQEDHDQPTIKAFVLMADCDSASKMKGIIPKFNLDGFAGMLTVLRQSQDPSLIDAAGRLALFMLQYYCAQNKQLPQQCVSAMSHSLNGLKTYPQEKECELQDTTITNMYQQPGPIAAAYADLIRRSLKRD
jgi:hypothetical protein